MNHFTSKNHHIADVQHFMDCSYLAGIVRRLHLSSFAAKGRDQPELNAHLRCDIGEDDMRPTAGQSLLRQEAARANALDTMLLRSF